MTSTIECPNHEGAFDCTPFCELCAGDQEIEREIGAIKLTDNQGNLAAEMGEK